MSISRRRLVGLAARTALAQATGGGAHAHLLYEAQYGAAPGPGGGAIFATRQAAAAADTGAAEVLWVGDLVYRPSAEAAPALVTADGQGWVPAGPVFLDHWDVDPSGEADATDALQAAIDFCITAGVGELSIPDGIFRIRGVTVGGPLHIVGNPRSAIFRMFDPEGTAFTFDDTHSGMIGCRLQGNDRGGTGVAFARADHSKGSGILIGTEIERFRIGVHNRGRGGLNFDRIQVLGCSRAAVESAGNFMESRITNSTLWCFGNGGDALVVDRESDDMVNPEGWVVAHCTILATGGSPFVCRAALSVRLLACTFSEGVKPLLIEGGPNAITGLQFIGCWHQIQSPEKLPTMLVRGSRISNIHVMGGQIIHEAGASGVRLEGPGPQSIRFTDVDFRVGRRDREALADTTIGIENRGAKAVFVTGCTFRYYVEGARNVAESEGAVTRYDGNRFTVPPFDDLSPASSLGVNFGAGSSPAVGNFTLFVQDGAPEDPALAFQSRPGTGLCRRGDGMAFVHDGAMGAGFDPRGVIVPRSGALCGQAERMEADTAISFEPEFPAGMILVSTEDAACEFRYSVDARRAECVPTIANPPVDIAAASGVLGGRDGPPGTLSVSAHRDGRIYIENRRAPGAVRITLRA
ncbi:hypothetical protein [Roseivivax sediminis]|uniref:Pectate lyase superfamily protein n=1 Tax=Roseivivax sediminis TaxID=936889 RepID=A0A1I1UDG5_9RHOB|nr:hypothetical protein [Roseivivax sediminis]SFD68665.1 hypothetical protein SAMN04515678_102285 [Roseivivax sediminis]